MRVVTIINPAAGKAEPVLSTLSDAFGAASVDWDVRVTTGAGDAERFASAALAEGVDRIAAYGGDGTISAIASCLAGTGIPLAILPGGTGNAVAQEFQIPLRLEDAVSLATDPTALVTPMDCMRYDEQRSILRLGIGADARMILSADREAKNSFGWFAYLAAAVQEVRHSKRARYQINLDERELEFDALTLIVANVGRLGRAGMRLAPNVDPTDGLLDVFAIRSGGFSSALNVGAQLLGLDASDPADVPTTANQDKPIAHWRAQHVRVACDPQQSVQGDGDPVGETPLEVAVEPAAIHVIRPRS